jgi:ATP/maltotriose-dependent transcriptional regulator MalT
LDRAVELTVEADQFRFEVMLHLGIALARAGNSTRAERVFTSVVDGSGDPSTRLHASMERAFVHIFQSSPKALSEAQELVEESISALEKLDDASGMAKAWRLMATVSWIKAQFHPGIESLRRALEYAKGHDRFQEMQITSELIMALAFGPTPVQEVIREGEQMLDQVEDRIVRATLLSTLRLMYAWVGQFDHARDLGERATKICRDLGHNVLLGWWTEEAALVEIAAGNLAAAEQELRRGCDALTEMGEKAALSTKAAILADVIFSQGRFEEADQWVALSEKTAARDDIASQARWKSVRSKIMATRGNRDRAIRLAQEAVDLVDSSDDLDLRGEVWLCCAKTQRLTAQSTQALESAKVSVDLHEKKGNIMSATRARRLVEELIGEASAS